MHVDDVAKAAIYFMENEIESNLINIGWGKEITIKELVELISIKTDFEGNIVWDKSKKDGTVHKCLDVSKMNEAGFKPLITLQKGIDLTIDSYCLEKYEKTFKDLLR